MKKLCYMHLQHLISCVIRVVLMTEIQLIEGIAAEVRS